MVTGVAEVTDTVVTVKVALVAPEATVTLAGTPATALSLLLNETTAPPEGAAPDKVTVPVELLPPVTLAGLRLREERLTEELEGLTVSVASCVLPLKLAEIVTGVEELTDTVLIVKVALVAP